MLKFPLPVVFGFAFVGQFPLLIVIKNYTSYLGFRLSRKRQHYLIDFIQLDLEVSNLKDLLVLVLHSYNNSPQRFFFFSLETTIN